MHGLSPVALCGLLIARASLVAEDRLWSARASVAVAAGLWSTGSVVAAHGLGCSEACRNFLDQGTGPTSPALASRFPLYRQGNTWIHFTNL